MSFETIISIGLMGVMMFTALAFGAVEPWSLAVFGLTDLALLALWMAQAVARGRLTASLPGVAAPLVALMLWGLLQSLTFTDSAGKRFSISLDAEATRLTLEVLLVLFIAFLLSANFLTDERRLGWLRNFLIFFGLGLAVFGLVQKFTWNGKYYWVIEPTTPPSSPFGPFVNHNHFAGYVEMIAPLPITLILRRVVKGELAFLYGFAAAMMALAVVMSLSRGGMISLMAGLMFVVAFGFKPGASGEGAILDSQSAIPESQSAIKWPVAFSRIGAMVVMVVTIGAGVWWVGADPVIRRMEKGALTDGAMEAPSKDPAKETFFQSRGWIWRDTREMIRENWATGVGLGAYHTAYPIYSTRDGTLVVSQAHNDYLQMLADGGAIGAAIALWFILLLARDIRRASRHRNPMMAATAMGAAAGLFSLLVHSLFDFNFQIPSNALLFLVLTSVVSQTASRAESSTRARRRAFPEDGGVILKTQLISFKRVLGLAWSVCLVGMILSLAVYGQSGQERPRAGGATGSGSGNGGGGGGRVTPDVVMVGDDDYKLASSDVIEVIVEDAPELSVNYKINSAGMIPLRFLGATHVAGKTTDEVGRLITEGLRGRYLKDPKVYVSVKQYNSRTFFIQGAVKQPGTYVIAGKPTLFKLITIAGGLQENHGGTAYIFREVKAKPEKLETGSRQHDAASDNGNIRVREIVSNAKGTDKDEVVEGEADYELVTANIGGILRGRLDHNIIVQPSDVVYIPPADVFYVAGEVKQPGQFQLRQGITLRQAISLAGGTPFKAKLDKGIIFRTDPATGNFTEIPVDIGAIMSGKNQDVQILGNDVIWVPSSAMKSFGSTVLMTLIPSLIFRLPMGR